MDRTGLQSWSPPFFAGAATVEVALAPVIDFKEINEILTSLN